MELKAEDFHTYKGKKIENMTREELILALKHVGRLYFESIEERCNRFQRLINLLSRSK